MPSALLFLIVPLAVVVLTAGLWVPLLFWLRRRRYEQRFTALAAELGTVKSGDRLPVPGFADRCAVHLHPAGRNTPVTLEVTLSDRRDGSLSRPTILLRRERWTDRLGKALGLNREVQIGDAAFDRAVYIESDAPDAVLHWLLGDATRRRAALDVFALGFSELTIHGRWSLLSASRPRPRTVHLDAGVVRDVARCLSLLAPGIPAHDPRDDAAMRAASSVVPGVLAVIAVVAALAVPVATFALRDAFHPIADDLYFVALPVAGSLFVLALPLVGLAVRGHSDSFRTFLAAALALLWLMPPSTVGAFLLINALADTAPSARRPSRVVDHSFSTGKGAGYRLWLAGLRKGDETFKVEVSGDTYLRVATSGAVVVTTGPGALGFEWIRRIDPAPKR
jgi:hypothetical protein